MHDNLLLTLTGGLTVALILGYVTQRLGLSPIVGYLLAGVAVGPYTPGFEADHHLAEQLAKVGVILLMFGVGLHFHLKELLVALAQIGEFSFILADLGKRMGILPGPPPTPSSPRPSSPSRATRCSTASSITRLCGVGCARFVNPTLLLPPTPPRRPSTAPWWSAMSPSAGR